MVTNTLLDINAITAEVQMLLENEAGFSNRVQRQFDSKFGNEGAMIGNSLRIRIPPRYVVEGNNNPGITPADTTETEAVIVASNLSKIAVQFSDSQMSLELNDFSEIVAKPIASQIGTQVDVVGLQQINGYSDAGSTFSSNNGAKSPIYNLATAGAVNNITGPAAWTGNDLNSAATTPREAAAVFNNALATISEEGGQSGDKFCIIDPYSQASTVPALGSLFNPNATIAEQYKTGYLGQQASAMFHSSPNVGTFTSGTWTNSANLQVNAVVVEGTSTLVLKAVGNNAVINRGDVLVVAGPAASLTAGVFQVNPQNRNSTGRQRMFTVVTDATADGSGNVTVTVSPEIRAAGAYMTVSRLPTTNDRVTFIGTPGTATRSNLFYHKNAFGLAIAPLPSKLAGAEVGYARSTKESDWSIRFVKQYDISSGVEISRFEILYGWSTIRASLAVKLLG